MFSANLLSWRSVTHFPSVILKRKMSSCKVAVCQMTSSSNKIDNLENVKKLVKQAAAEDVQMMFFPECCDYIATSKNQSREMAESLLGVTMQAYKSVAKEYKMWLSIGGFHELAVAAAEGKDNKMYNSHVIIDNQGDIRSIYRKLHLFDVNIPEKNIDLRESEYVLSGTELVAPIQSPAGSIGQLICYDLRFAEPSIMLRRTGAEILTFPSAFTSTTGKAHWETLLKARAIENQTYVIAANQYGRHNETRNSYGQSLIIDPWGKSLAECVKYDPEAVPGAPSTNFSYAVATIDGALLQKIRQEMPVFEHRRNDIYRIESPLSCPEIDSCDPYMFANKRIPARTVFYRTKLSYAFTNIRCVVPGHVLVSSIRLAPRLEDLTQEEVSDLFRTVIKVQKVMEKVHNSESSTICVQDGKHAGQTIPHIHCHILPRRMNDFENNDDIYQEMAKHDRENNQKPLRTDDDMAQEASILRPHFVS